MTFLTLLPLPPKCWLYRPTPPSNLGFMPTFEKFLQVFSKSSTSNISLGNTQGQRCIMGSRTIDVMEILHVKKQVLLLIGQRLSFSIVLQSPQAASKALVLSEIKSSYANLALTMRTRLITNLHQPLTAASQVLCLQGCATTPNTKLCFGVSR